MPINNKKPKANQGQPSTSTTNEPVEASNAGFHVAQPTQEALEQTQEAAQQTAAGASQLMGHTILDQLNQAQAYKRKLIDEASELLAQELSPIQVASELWTVTAGKLLSGMKSADRSFGLSSGVLLPSVPVLQQVSLAGLFPESSQTESKQLHSQSSQKNEK